MNYLMKIYKNYWQRKMLFILMMKLQLILATNNQCPDIISYHNPIFDYNFGVYSFLRVPMTNTLLINTIDQTSFSQNVVYYTDLSSPSRQIINVVRPDFTINVMDYVDLTNQILISNSNKLILADPYSFQSVMSLDLQFTSHLFVIPNTKYAIITRWRNQLLILDILSFQIVKTLDHSSDPDVYFKYQYISKIYNFTCSTDQVIISSNEGGIIAWSINLNTMVGTYHGLIDYTKTNYSSYYYRFDKFPGQDIIFVGGQYYELIAIKIQQFNKGQYIKMMHTYLFSGSINTSINQIMFQYINYNTYNQAVLLVADNNYINYVNLIVDLPNNIITAPYDYNPFYYNIVSYYEWYYVQGTTLIYMSYKDSATIFNFQTGDFDNQLYFRNDKLSRRFIFEGEGQSLLTIIFGQDIYYSQTNSLQDFYHTSYDKLSYQMYSNYNSFLKVKNCDVCLLVKLRDNANQNKDYVSTTKIYPMDEKDYPQPIPFSWDQVGRSLDPFYYNNQIWIVLAFPNKNILNSKVNGLFQLVNAQNTTQFFVLTSPNQTQNNYNTSFAVASIYDLINPEIVGVDQQGSVYSWDLLSPTLNFKFSLQLKNCFNSQIGEIFQYNITRKLIVACDDYSVYSFDLKTQDQQLLTTLTSVPISIRAFNSIQMVVLPDYIGSIVYLYKYNSNSNTFVYHLSIYQGQLTDYLFHVELLKNNILWIQYKYSFTFYPIDGCIDDPTVCTQCSQNYYFNITNQLDKYGSYGQGSSLSSYTTSQNYFQTILNAQFYKSIIKAVNNIQVFIQINPNNSFYLISQLTNFSFKSLISLTISSVSDQQLATIVYSNSLIFEDYNSVNLLNIQIMFLDTDKNTCGLEFSNIKNVVQINNIQLRAYKNPLISCQSIEISNTYVQVQNYTITSENFANNYFIFSTLNTNQISIANFSLLNCQFGDQFSILQQNTDVQAIIQNIVLENNYCSQANSIFQNPTALFSAGHYTVSSVFIQNNTFCNKNIFQAITSIKHLSQTFSFLNISLINNKFLTRTTYLLFNSFYSILSDPSHQLILKNSSFYNNSLFTQSQRDLKGASLIQTNKIQNISIENVNFLDHFDIQLGAFDESQLISVNNFNCTNNQFFLNQLNNQQTQGCLQINEAAIVLFDTVQVNYKKAQDNSLFLISNYNYKQSQVNISNAQFTNLILNQTQMNTFVNPLQIIGSYQINLDIQNSYFVNNSLISLQYSLTYSTTGLWFENFVGQSIIFNGTFENNYSNSIYNNIHIQTDSLIIQQCKFQNSTFSEINLYDNQYNKLFTQLGGMINAIINSVIITNTQFKQSTAIMGSFLYFQSFGQNLNILINSTKFTEGYSQIDGGAMYLNPINNLLNFSCIDCEFRNIFSLSQLSSSIKILQQNQKNGTNNITFNGGIIQTIQGILDNYFIQAANSQIQMIDISQVTYQQFQSSELPFLIYQAKQNQQQSTIIYSSFSVLYINNCNISNLSITNQQSSIPLIIQSENSTITISSTYISNCEYTKNMVQLNGGKLILDNILFQKIQQYQQTQMLSNDLQLIPNLNQYSILVASGAFIQIQNNSSFSMLSCTSCNGGLLQMLNGNIKISNSSFYQITSQYGGAFFITGLFGTNQIINSKFQNCQSQYNGGVAYIQFNDENQLSLNIDSAQFFNNTSLNGRGGAIYAISQNINPQFINFNINNSNFINNIAQIGAAIYEQNISLQVNSSIFKNNFAKIFGSDKISYASKLDLANIEQLISKYNAKQYDDHLEINDFRSGDVINNISFKMMNSDNEVIFPINKQEYQTYSVQVKINPNTQNKDSYEISGDQQAYYNISSQTFTFSQLNIVGTPGSSFKIQFFSDQIFILNELTNQFEQNYTFDFVINFRKCISGEQIKEYNSLVQCDICQNNTYSFDVQPCQNCPTGGICLGGDKIEVQYGYWRKSEDSVIIIDCENQESNCVGGSFGNSVCYQGHIGALCEECDIYGKIWQKVFAKSAKYSCAECEKMQNNTWIILGLTSWTLFSMMIAIRGNINYLKIEAIQNNIMKNTIKKMQNRKKSEIENSQRLKSISFSKGLHTFFKNRPKSKSQNRRLNLTNLNDQMKQSIYIKMFTNYFQIVSSIATFNLTIPSGQPIKQTMSSVDCMLVKINTEIPIIYYRMIFSQIIPIIYLLIFCLGLFIYHIVKSKNEKFPYYVLSTASIFLIIYVQPDLVAQIIALLSCRRIGDTSYILSNVSYECYTDQHIKYILLVILPLMLIWIFLLPFVLFISIKRNQNQLSNPNIKLKYGFLYNEYQDHAYYWEFIKMAEKLAIILSLNFYSQQIVIKGILVFLAISLYGISSMIIKPYKEEDINQVDINSTNVCAITVLFGIFIYQNPFPYFYYTALGIIILINSIFIFNMLKQIINNYYQLLKQSFKNILSFLASKIHILKKYEQKTNPKQNTCNPEIKAKVQMAFQRYLQMNQNEKKQFFLNLLEQRLMLCHKDIFVDKSQAKIQTPYQIPELRKQDQESEKNSFILEQDVDQALNSVKTNNFQTLEQHFAKVTPNQQNRNIFQNNEVPNSPCLSIFEIDGFSIQKVNQ
ncbi:transmembrane protein, putative (macronuclear) [Tetrahymena thermophila SB210]|uniref:Transmembrane protein, putative n=1 Tax=Tetrahymena thermophila (strain SB210) TaxID=312017 RepID=W7XFI3_TETTS|nr:transmembrane protein, putative [Tetrahymena thermophila SB210]EWS75588.1 transmembrane protein, putative [Tetrahymena thermophila SB210]|eukprot:XP_012651888.1 transmembrane protein, putative [Tetrahymena thermophila SB210]